MSYDIYFVRRDPGQSFEDALDELEGEFPDGDPEELSDDDQEWWDQLVPRAREILGEVELNEDSDVAFELTAPASGVELTLLSGEVEIHVPEPPAGMDEVELMSTVYELARAVEDVTGMEGYDPQVGEPIRDRLDLGSAVDEQVSVDDVDDPPVPSLPAPSSPVPIGDARPDMAPGPPQPRRWWEFWRA